jgi:tetratricopeptide (TPR) repeat protein
MRTWRNRLFPGSLALALGLACGGCPPERRPDPAPHQGAREGERSLFSIPGMTRAILEMDAARGTPGMHQLQVEHDRAFRASPQDPFKRFLYAYSLDDRNAAWQEMSKVTKLNDRFYWVHVGMGVILDEWKVYDQAEAQFQRALELGPDIALGLARYGRMLLRRGDGPLAVERLEAALARLPEENGFRLDLARALDLAGRLEDARRAYLEALEREPGLFAGHVELARLLARLEDRAGAVEAYARAAELEPADHGVRRARADLLLGLERLPESEQAYREACALRPEDLDCWRALAEVGRLQQNRETRVFAHEQMVRAEPGLVEANAFLGPLYLEAGEIERAQPAFLAVLRARPNDVEALAGLAEIHDRADEADRALELCERVLELNPEHGPTRAIQARLFARFHILPEAIQDKTPDRVFARNQQKLGEVYKLRLKERPGLAGQMVLKVSVDNDGQVVDVRLARNEVGDEVLELCARWNLRRSRFPAGFGATYDFEVSLRPGSP